MKLRYRIEERGYYIPQYFDEKTEKWVDFKAKHVTGELRLIAIYLGKSDSWGANIWHFKPINKENNGDMAVFFDNELKVCAFLGAAKTFFSNRTKEFDI